MSTSTWDYGIISQCTTKLTDLRDRAVSNKNNMDEIINSLQLAMDAESGKAFIAAYNEKVETINQFGNLLNHEAETLNKVMRHMQNVDSETAAYIRNHFA